MREEKEADAILIQVNIAVYEKSKELGIQLHIVIVPFICESTYICTY